MFVTGIVVKILSFADFGIAPIVDILGQCYGHVNLLRIV